MEKTHQKTGLDLLETELNKMRNSLIESGKSDATIKKYVRDLRTYLNFATETTGSVSHRFDRAVLSSFRVYAREHYKITSANSMFARINYYLSMNRFNDLKISSFRIQRDVFRDDSKLLKKEEYLQLCREAETKGNQRLLYIMQTLSSTGIRISELQFITVDALLTGRAVVCLKGKTRTVLLPGKLCSRLRDYAAEQGITEGSIFVTNSGRPVDRSNVLHEMKRLSISAGIDPQKVFPHNFRHLFALTFYQSEKDVCHLADMLGHTSIETTRIYTATGQNELVKTIERLGLL